MHHTLYCRVVDTTGRPLPDVAVTIVAAPQALPDLAQLTNMEGELDWGALPAGNYTLHVQHGNHSKRVTTSLPLSDTLVVTLP